jgi:enoyl-CoA hydratase/carnithine racemase
MNSRVSVAIDDGVAAVRLSRPEKMNALDDLMFQALIESGERLRHEPKLRAVVLSGDGKAFCGGIDLGSLEQLGSQAPDALTRRPYGLTNMFQHAAWVWHDLPVPVIAAVHGVAFGGGFQIMLGADTRIAAADARFSVMEIRWGLVPDMAGTLLMRQLARDDIVRELTYTGRIFSATEAQSYGFVTRVSDDPLADALALAKDIARQSPDAVREAKRLFNGLSPVATLADGLRAESDAQGRLIGSFNQREAVSAGFQKRPPLFKDAGAD